MGSGRSRSVSGIFLIPGDMESLSKRPRWPDQSMPINVAMTNGDATSGGGALERSKIRPWSCSPAQMRFKIINGTMNAGCDGSSGWLEFRVAKDHMSAKLKGERPQQTRIDNKSIPRGADCNEKTATMELSNRETSSTASRE